MCKHIYNPEKTYPKGTPFTYLISWTDLDVHYYGVRYSKKCHPDDLWTIYFTSSPIVKQYRIANGEPDVIKIDFVFDTGEEAREYEELFLTENDCARNNNWLNRYNGRGNFCCTGHSDETKLKMKNTSKGMFFVNNGTIQKLIHPKFIQEYLDLGWEQKKLPLSTKHKQKKSDVMKNRITINDGHNQKLIHPEFINDYLNLNWKLGSLPKSRESIQKNIDSMKGRITINNGINIKKIKPEFIQEYLDLGWMFGALPKNEEFKLKCSLRMKNNKIALGLKHSQDVKNNQSKKMQGNSLAKINKGKIWINNGIINKFITQDDAKSIYYPLGFFDGMIKK